MTAEYGLDSSFQPKTPVETWRFPFLENFSHRFLFNEAYSGFLDTGEKVKALWSRSIEQGMTNALMQAQYSCEPELVSFQGDDEDSVDYWLTYKGIRIDSFSQPLDIFHFSRVGEAEKVATMEVETYRGKNFRYSRLVSLQMHDEELPVTNSAFYFVNNQLFFVRQITQPSILFSAFGPEDEKQTLAVRFGYSDSYKAKYLVVEAGLQYQDNTHFYQNVDGSFTRSRNLRVSDAICGEMEAFDIYNDGQIVSEGFNLPRAIENMGNFSPATKT